MLPQECENTEQYLVENADFSELSFSESNIGAIAGIILACISIEGFMFVYFPLKLANLPFKVTFSLNLYSFERCLAP